jgi:cysteine desulfurase
MPYLDHHAATPLSAGARRAMEEALAEGQAHPGSQHAAGRRARARLEAARSAVAAAVSAPAADVVLVSGGTEAVNLAVAAASGTIATSRLEHPSVVRSIERAGARGSRVIHLDAGRLLPDLDAALAEGARFVALQWVNHETGLVLPIAEVAKRTREAGAMLFVDATQALGKIEVDVRVGIDLLAISSGKIGGPIGAGALYVRRGITLDPLLVGGREERGRRAGVPSPILCAGFAAALSELPARLAEMPRIARERDRLEAFLIQRGALATATPGCARAATVTHVSVPGWQGPLLVAALDLEGLAASSGAACSSGLDEPSPAVLALHPEEPWRASAALRLSLGAETSATDVEEALQILARVLSRAPSAPR